MSRGWWILRWRLLRVLVGLPLWFAVALLNGCREFLREFAREWSERPRYAQADAAYEDGEER